MHIFLPSYKSDKSSTVGLQTMNDDILLVEQSNNATIVTLNRPQQYNALSESMLDALQNAIDTISADSRTLVIRANGKAFCAGHDLKEMRASPSQKYYEQLFTKCSTMMQSLISLPIPVIAEVQGMATAAGCQLVANCDLAIAANDVQFAVSGINLGLFCSTPSVPLSRNISRKRAFEMLMSGDFIDAEKAVQWGLLNHAVPRNELGPTVTALCDKIATKPRVAVTTGKSLFYSQVELPLVDAYKLAGNVMACNMMAEDTEEGIDAFIEKRTPNFKHD